MLPSRCTVGADSPAVLTVAPSLSIGLTFSTSEEKPAVTVPRLARPVGAQVTCPRSRRRAVSEPGARLGPWSLPDDCAIAPPKQPQPVVCPSVSLSDSSFLERLGRHLVICASCDWVVPSSWHRPSFSFWENQSPSYYSPSEA